jgi:hypothetical protein
MQEGAEGIHKEKGRRKNQQLTPSSSKKFSASQ